MCRPLAFVDLARKRVSARVIAERLDASFGIDRRRSWAHHDAALKLSSLNRLLDFVAESDVEAREFEVTKDPRSGESAPNPVRTLAIDVSESAPAGDAPFALYRGRYYTVADTPWDRRAFTVLYNLFQMTVTDVSQVGLPITISK